MLDEEAAANSTCFSFDNLCEIKYFVMLFSRFVILKDLNTYECHKLVVEGFKVINYHMFLFYYILKKKNE